MSAPPGAVASRWDQAARAVARETGATNAQADAWLNLVWVGMWIGDELAGDPAAHGSLRKFLEANYADAPTLPRALRLAVT